MKRPSRPTRQDEWTAAREAAVGDLAPMREPTPKAERVGDLGSPVSEEPEWLRDIPDEANGSAPSKSRGKKEVGEKQSKAMTREEFHGALQARGINLYRNEDNAVVYMSTPKYGRIPVQATHDASLRRVAEKHCKKTLAPERFRFYVDSLANENPIRPFKDWLDGLEPKPGCEPLLATWPVHLWGAEDSELVRFIARTAFCVPVLLANHPGRRVRVVPTLVGGMGCGKSTFVEHLLPEHLRDDYFTESFPLDASDDEMARMVRGRSIVLMEELKGLRRAGWASIKDTTTRTRFSLVPKYQERQQVYQRTWLFVATANPGFSLPADPVAAQRFLILELPNKRATVDPKSWLAEHRDSLWWQAREYMSAFGCVDWDTPANLADERATAADAHTDAGGPERFVADLTAERTESITARELGELLPEGMSSRVVGGYLRRAGWKAKNSRVAGKMVRRWCPPLQTRL